MATLGLAGVIAIELRTAVVTVTCADPEIDLNVALTIEFPRATPVTCPFWPATLPTVTESGLVLFHATELVRLSAVPSEKVPIAVN